MAHLFDGLDWTFDKISAAYDAMAPIALDDLRLDIYPNQIEVISSEQMLDAYSSVGMPLMYQHWSFGKHFLREEYLYRKGRRGLAYELVINSNPCITYLMEENTMALQALVIAHASFGHNHFFKNNYLFRQWTDA
ncbi:MAG TPA: SpoVR family protein, partial [Rhizobiaceae bacterium]|nr:SpoVR family protein [Rhizobiaceae bacterium]